MNVSYQIPVLQKAIRVLHAIADHSGEPTTNSLARTLKIAPATSYRILQTFARAGWVNVRDDDHCELGLGLLPITQGIQQQPPFPLPPVRPIGSFRGLPQKANS